MRNEPCSKISIIKIQVKYFLTNTSVGLVFWTYQRYRVSAKARGNEFKKFRNWSFFFCSFRVFSCLFVFFRVFSCLFVASSCCYYVQLPICTFDNEEIKLAMGLFILKPSSDIVSRYLFAVLELNCRRRSKTITMSRKWNMNLTLTTCVFSLLTSLKCLWNYISIYFMWWNRLLFIVAVS